jgi:hypothetical protein
MPCVGEVLLVLLCLDQWAFNMHCGEHVRTHRTHCGEHVRANASPPLHVGCVAEAKYGPFLLKAHDLLRKAAARAGDKRSAHYNPQQGNQKTSAMVQAVLLDALAGRDEGQTAPSGGFTDVGMHTGGHARSTTWPFVRAVLPALLGSQNKHLSYRVTMAQIQLWSAERALPGDTQEDTQGRNIMQMLQAAASEGAALAVEGHDMGDFEARCVLTRHQLEQAAQHRASLEAQSFELPLVRREEVQVRRPWLLLPAPRLPVRCSGSLEASRVEQGAPNPEIALVHAFVHSLSSAAAWTWRPEQAD